MNNDVIKVQLSCGVDYYKGDKGDKPIKGVDYFTQEDIADIVEQIETGGVDLDGYATKEYVDNAVSGVVVSETDPTVPEWAKQANKPSYTASEVGALPADTQLFSGNYNDLRNKPAIPTVPANVSAFNNDAGYLTDVEFHDTMNMTSVSVNSAGLYVETLDNEQNPVYRTDVLNMGVSANGPSGGVAMGNGQLMFVEPTNGNMLEVTIDENADSLYVNGDKVALVNDIPNLTGYATESYVDDAIANIPAGGITVETDPTVPSWAKQANKPTYTAQEVGALPANTALFSGDYNDLSNKPTIPPAPIVIQATLAGQPTVDSNGNYNVTLAITSNNMAEAYEQYQTNPSTVGISVDLTAMGIPSKMYMDCESFYRDEVDGGGYAYTTYGEFNDSSFSWQFGFEFHNVNIYLSSQGGSSGTLTGIATVHQLASKANSADLATVATSGDYNDLTNKPTIPTAYTLPTATTSTLGGVKVDGTTITITDGVISATSSGGGSSSYTAGQGISIDNGEISVDFGNEIENGGFSFAQHYDNENYYEYTSNIYPYEINITSYGEADPETGDQETKGILITGEGITFDDTGDTHTLGVSNGELVFDDSPIGSGGGSSYTAGDGISIDSNGVISRDNGTYPLFGLLLNLFTDMMTAPYNQQASIRNLNLSVIGGNETVAGHIQNLKSYGMTIINKQTTANDWLQILSALDPAITSVSTQFKEFGCWSSVPSQYTLSGGNGTRSPTELASATNGFNTVLVMFDNKQSADSYFRWRFIQNPHILFQNHYFNSLQGLTSHSVAGAIDEVATNLNTRIPSAPTTDGDYVLKVSVSNGTPTYSWVAE